jgi:membrane protein implicated in regulation of membrane protease activity
MSEVFFGDNAAWFTVPGIVGTAFFLLRIVMMLVGAGAHDLGVEVHGDLHVGDAHGGGLQGDAAHPDSTDAFQILSTQSIAAFMMGFGWGGLAAFKGSGWHWGAVIVAGTACGAAMVWVLGMLLRGMVDLQSSGNIPLGAALGREGDVYVTVPSGGRGQVKVTVRDHQRIYNAVTGGEDLPSGTRVRVVQVNDDNTLTVARA